jgi:hypothetical protein
MWNFIRNNSPSTESSNPKNRCFTKFLKWKTYRKGDIRNKDRKKCNGKQLRRLCSYNKYSSKIDSFFKTFIIKRKRKMFKNYLIKWITINNNKHYFSIFNKNTKRTKHIAIQLIDLCYFIKKNMEQFIYKIHISDNQNIWKTLGKKWYSLPYK